MIPRHERSRLALEHRSQRDQTFAFVKGLVIGILLEAIALMIVAIIVTVHAS